MKVVSLKNACVTASFLVAFGHANSALAHTQTGALGNGPATTDHYTVTCSTDSGGETYRLSFRVKDDTAGTSKVSVQTRKGSKARNIADTNGGDGTYSEVTYNNSGNGAYTVLVDKSFTGLDTYTLEFHCETQTGVHTGTSIVKNQDQ